VRGEQSGAVRGSSARIRSFPSRARECAHLGALPPDSLVAGVEVSPAARLERLVEEATAVVHVVAEALEQTEMHFSQPPFSRLPAQLLCTHLVLHSLPGPTKAVQTKTSLSGVLLMAPPQRWQVLLGPWRLRSRPRRTGVSPAPWSPTPRSWCTCGCTCTCSCSPRSSSMGSGEGASTQVRRGLRGNTHGPPPAHVVSRLE